MTIDEAIKERQKVIEVQEKLYEEASTNESKEIIKSATDNDRQLVEWLTEYKELKNSIGAVKLKDMKEAVKLLQELNTENDQIRSQLAYAKGLLKLAVEQMAGVGAVCDCVCSKNCPLDECGKFTFHDEIIKLIES